MGTFKDEVNGKPIREFGGLHAKMYSILQEDGVDKKVAKCVPEVSIRQDLQHVMYKKCLDDQHKKYVTSCIIHSKQYNLCTIQQCKVSLASYDNKRYILVNGQDTLAYGHYKIAELESGLKRNYSEGDVMEPLSKTVCVNVKV